MTAQITQDLYVDQYADFTYSFPPWSPGGTLADFTGATASLMVRANPGDLSPLVSISTTASSQGSVVLGLPNAGAGAVPQGVVQVNVASSQTALLATPLARYDLFVVWPNGQKQLFATGRVYVAPGNDH